MVAKDEAIFVQCLGAIYPRPLFAMFNALPDAVEGDTSAA
jgi:hypothetical protein